MSRKFIASVLAASLAITSFSAAPAKAGNDDLVKFLAGATALIIIGKALDGKGRSSVRYDYGYHNHGNQGHTHRYDNDHKHHKGYTPPVHNGRHYDDNHSGKYGHQGQHQARKVLPGACEVSVRMENGRRNFLNSRCLERRNVKTQNLPSRCHITAGRDRHGKITGYTTQCLQNRGYKITNR